MTDDDDGSDELPTKETVIPALLEAWKTHLDACPTCTSARTSDELCEEGKAMWPDTEDNRTGGIP